MPMPIASITPATKSRRKGLGTSEGKENMNYPESAGRRGECELRERVSDPSEQRVIQEYDLGRVGHLVRGLHLSVDEVGPEE